MATRANHRPCVGYPTFERILVHVATLADDSASRGASPTAGEGRSRSADSAGP